MISLPQEKFVGAIGVFRLFVRCITEHMKATSHGWEWFRVAAFGQTRCTDCAVPLPDGHLAFWEISESAQWANESGFWVCFECAYDRCAEAGVRLPPVPEEVL